jgi:hypothetical protein
MPNTLIPIQTVTLSATATSITFSNIPQNYTDLKFVMSFRTTDSNSNYSPIGIQVDGATPGNSYKSVAGNGSSNVNYGTSNDTFTASTAGGSWTRISASGVQAGATTANVFSSNEFYITNYTSSTTKSYSFDSVTENNATTAYAELTAGTITSSSAITSIVFANRDGSWAANSTVTLYGISNGVKATGGTLTVAGGYAYHTFTSTGSFLPSQKITGAEILSIAGGGGGGGNKGGGGGAGGLRYLNSQTLNAGNSYTALVGSGGAGSASTTGPGSNGSDSVIMSFTSTGGGGGGGGDAGGGTNINGRDGGSGGGSANNGAGTPVVGVGVVGQGNNGGAVDIASSLNPGGGGGATQAGFSGVAGDTQGFGGSGSSSYSVWGSVTGTGQLVGGVYYYAGGGGGGSSVTDYNAAGGSGGGGIGGRRSVNDDTAGSANTGGGGGGGSTGAAAQSGSAGGSGIIIIRYPLS